jgi:hypothetical protein
MSRIEARIGSRPGTEVRERALSAIRSGPAAVAPAVALTVLAACALAVLILTVAVDEGGQPPANEWVRGVAAALCALIGIGFLVRSIRGQDRAQASRRDEATERALTTGLISVAVLFVLALVPVWLMAARTHPPTEEWLGYGFFDKRWVISTFLLGTIGVMVVLVAVAQLVRAAATAPASWGGWARAAFEPEGGAAPPRLGSDRDWKRTLLAALPALVLAFYFFGPPWHVALSEVNLHENPMLSGVQAIANGAVPYIDEAAVQYGPGSELIHYAYMQAAGFDLQGFRESTVLLYLVGSAIFFAIVFIRLPFKLAAIASLASVVLFPALQMIAFQGDGSVDNQIRLSMEGIWGWPNPMRYLGVFALAMLFPVIPGLRTRRRSIAAAAGLGVFWGLMCFISQENLPGGVIALGVIALLLGLSQTVGARALLRSLAGVAAGFLAVVVVVLAYYAANGELTSFLELYYLIPPAVAAGYSDTRYFGGFDGLWGQTYFLLPVLLALLCAASVLILRPLRVARSWSPERVLLVSALVAAAVCNVGSIPRADPPHLINTMMALPVAVVLAAAYLPRLLGVESPGRRWVATAGIAIAAVALLPMDQFEKAPNRLAWPLERFSYESPALEWQRADPNSVAAQRLTPEVVRRPGQWCCGYFRDPVTMGEFVRVLNRMNAEIGDRRVYVANFIDGLHPGAAYFLADLKPAPILLEPLTMLMNERLLDEYLAFYRDHLGEVEAVAAVYPNLPEVKMFKRAYPDYETVRIPYTWGTVTVLTR